MNNNTNSMNFLDIITLLSFCISLMNLDENLGQSDKQDLQNTLSNEINYLLQEIHGHLKSQDEKLDKILEEISNGD